VSFGVEFGLNTIGKMIEENKKRLNGHFVAGVVGNKDSLEQDRRLIITSRAFRKSFISRLPRSVVGSPGNHNPFTGVRGRNNFIRIYETLY
jgi:hypothetical protein